MGFRDSLGKFLGLPTSKDLEQLKSEIDLNKRLLEDQQVPSSFPSTSAQEQRKIEDTQGSVSKRTSVRQLQALYLNNQFIFRGVNVRADELVTRGYELIGEDQVGIDKCEELIYNSGGMNLFWQYSVNTDIAGDGYLEIIPNKKGDAILKLRHINPVNFGFWTDSTTQKIILNEKGEPKSYMQLITTPEGKEERVEISKNRIAHLRFNTFADEFNGISSIQPVYNTAIRLMNMEHAAAEAAVKTANPLLIGETTTKSPHELLKWSQMMGRVSGKEQIFLPQGMKLYTISPGNQNFNDYANYFLDAVVAALGVPKSILTGTGDASGGNRSTVTEQAKHFYSVIRSNQRYMEQVFNDIFKMYGELAGFKAPQLKFNDIADDSASNSQWAIELYKVGLLTLKESREMIGYDTTDEIRQEIAQENNPEIKPISGAKLPSQQNKSDMETYFPEDQFGKEGSQKGIKRDQKIAGVPSVI